MPTYLSDRITAKQIKKAARASRKRIKAAYSFSSLFSGVDANPKLAKSSNHNVATIPLHLAPASLSGWNVCPQASKGCIAACLHTAGNPIYMKGKAAARLERTRALMLDRADFLVVMAAEILSHAERCNTPKHKLFDFIPAVRLNATSDWPWHRTAVVIDGVHFSSIMEVFPGIQFYDYTKVTKRTAERLPSNYHITFSLSESNEGAAVTALANGVNVAAVFDVKRNGALPSTYKLGERVYKVFDADKHDYRPIDPHGSTGLIAGLRAKGDARGDTSGFVRAV